MFFEKITKIKMQKIPKKIQKATLIEENFTHRPASNIKPL